jgi:hypothetical protein
MINNVTGGHGAEAEPAEPRKTGRRVCMGVISSRAIDSWFREEWSETAMD